MREYFESLATAIQALAGSGEVVTAWFSAELSDFVRFNRGLVRQATHVNQATLTVSLIAGQRRCSHSCTLAFSETEDRTMLRAMVDQLRLELEHTPDDPYLLYNREPTSSERVTPAALPSAERVIDEVVGAGQGKDLVGFYAGGPSYRGFANSLGQRNWNEWGSFNLGWCLYHQRDKAVRSTYAGAAWDRGAFQSRMAEATVQLELITRPAVDLQPGEYRVYFAPPAVSELLGTLAWGGFGVKNVRTKHSSLVELYEGRRRFNPLVTMIEDTASGYGPNFQADGYLKPERVTLVEAGRGASTLVSPRSAQEYGLPINGAGDAESPRELVLAAGSLPAQQALSALDNGLYIGNLWYLNYSDRQHCRMTGMTRFACFQVKHGVIQSPLNVMRFDDTAYRFLGSELEALTAERTRMPDEDAYEERATGAITAPGLLVNNFRFTL